MYHEFILARDLCVQLRLDIPWVIMLVRAVSQGGGGGGIFIFGQCAFGIWGLLWMQWCIMGFFVCDMIDSVKATFEVNISWALILTEALFASGSQSGLILENVLCLLLLFNCALDVLKSELQSCRVQRNLTMFVTRRTARDSMICISQATCVGRHIALTGISVPSWRYYLSRCLCSGTRTVENQTLNQRFKMLLVLERTQFSSCELRA